jgi:hypothetical protein
MGWETRHGGKRYLYRNHRVDGRPVKTYLGAYEGRYGEFTRLVLAHDLDRSQRVHAEWRALQRVTWAGYRAKLAALTAPVDEVDGLLKDGAEVVLLANGYHRPNRGPWRRARGGTVASIFRKLNKRLDRIKEQVQGLEAVPLIDFQPSSIDPAAVDTCAKARAGDPAALAKLPEMVAVKGWADWMGDLGRQATARAIDRAVGGDPVWREAVTQRVAGLWKSLAGPEPTALDDLLLRRIVNSWVAVHAVELVQAIRPPRDPRQAAYLDRRVSQAQRRLTDACRALAAVRRRPVVLQVNAAVNQQVHNAPAG